MFHIIIIIVSWSHISFVHKRDRFWWPLSSQFWDIHLDLFLVARILDSSRRRWHRVHRIPHIGLQSCRNCIHRKFEQWYANSRMNRKWHTCRRLRWINKNRERMSNDNRFQRWGKKGKKHVQGARQWWHFKRRQTTARDCRRSSNWPPVTILLQLRLSSKQQSR